ncbi:MAG TPA: serine/threonine-protein kinase [Actinomycetes bacterium]|nr:serine/threonine-protein kinase [Actinomycetes bacterium]
MIADPWIGQTLVGYRIETVLGRGGMGVVYRAEHLSLGRKVALKVLSPALAASADFRRRFMLESRVAASLEHPNVIPIFEAGEAEDVLFIAMRYVEGADLGRVLERQAPLDPRRTVGLLGQVAGALDAAHARGLVHRDVKPGNVLISAELDPDGYEHCYLCDFGLIKSFDAPSDLTLSGQFIGTVPYMAPEQIRGEPLDGRTDVYALACVTFRCLTGRLPFDRGSDLANVEAHLHEPPPRASLVHRGLPPELDAILARAMAKAKVDRQPSCSALIADVRGTLEPAAVAPAVAWLDPEPTSPLGLGTVVAPLPEAAGVPHATAPAAGHVLPGAGLAALPPDARIGGQDRTRLEPLDPWAPPPQDLRPGAPPGGPTGEPAGTRASRRDTPGLAEPRPPEPPGRTARRAGAFRVPRFTPPAWLRRLPSIRQVPLPLLAAVLVVVVVLAVALTRSVTGGGRRPPASRPAAAGVDLAGGGSTGGEVAASCVNGWTTPVRGTAVRRRAFEAMRTRLGVRGLYTVSEMRYFTGGDGSARWYVRTTLLGGRPWRARWLIQQPPDGDPVVAAVAPAGTHGLRSPDWRGFQGEGPPRSYDGLPGRYAGVPYDFVTGADGRSPGLPADVRGCLAGS